MEWLQSRFALAANGTNVRTEVLAGVTTFLTMAYIIILDTSTDGVHRERSGRPEGGPGSPAS